MPKPGRLFRLPSLFPKEPLGESLLGSTIPGGQSESLELSDGQGGSKRRREGKSLFHFSVSKDEISFPEALFSFWVRSVGQGRRDLLHLLYSQGFLRSLLLPLALLKLVRSEGMKGGGTKVSPG